MPNKRSPWVVKRACIHTNKETAPEDEEANGMKRQQHERMSGEKKRREKKNSELNSGLIIVVKEKAHLNCTVAEYDPMLSHYTPTSYIAIAPPPHSPSSNPQFPCLLVVVVHRSNSWYSIEKLPIENCSRRTSTGRPATERVAQSPGRSINGLYLTWMAAVGAIDRGEKKESRHLQNGTEHSFSSLSPYTLYFMYVRRYVDVLPAVVWSYPATTTTGDGNDMNDRGTEK